MEKLSFIIVNYQSDSDTVQCVNSIKKYCSFIAYEIIIVNNSTSKLRNFFIHKSELEIKIIDMKSNVGFAKGCNIAISKSSGSWYVLINPDARLIDNSIELIYQSATEYTEKCLWGGVIRKEGKIIQSFDNFFKPQDRLKYHIKKYVNTILKRDSGKFGHKIQQHPFFVDYISGAFLLIPKKAWEMVGGMDEDFFLFYEEQDLQLRMSKHGIKRIMHPGATFEHKHSASINSTFLKEFLMLESELIFCQKHFKNSFFSYAYVLLLIFVVRTFADLFFKHDSLKNNYKRIRLILHRIHTWEK